MWPAKYAVQVAGWAAALHRHDRSAQYGLPGLEQRIMLSPVTGHRQHRLLARRSAAAQESPVTGITVAGRAAILLELYKGLLGVC